MKTRNLIKSVLFCLLLMGSLFACKKDKESSLVGVWKGTYTKNSDNTSLPLSFNIKADEVSPKIDLFVLDADGNTQGQGEWSLADKVFTARYSYTLDPAIFLVYQANFDSQTGKLSNGTWKYEGSPDNAGTWSMTKQP
ncbi:MAG: hypothetical protein ACKOW2_00875 [Sphingobacteriaceae bacterium]